MRVWTVDDVMTTAVVTVEPGASYREVVDLLIGRRISAVPVVNESVQVVGVVSEADLLRKIEYAGDEKPRLFDGRRRRDERAKAAVGTAADLMSAPPVIARTGMSIAAAARLMDAENVKRLPVIDDHGRLLGIVARSDLLKAHLRPDDELRDDVLTGMLAPYFADSVREVDAQVSDGAVTLTGRVDRASTADAAGQVTRQVPGVVTVVNAIDWVWDDRQTATGGGYGAA
ncbi:CBS domain-containing protein [Actinoplanes sp. GCM10030250]|uniref:CBS domain-containing protein n=1 Tax=Actinoplanes sp. GCM10030250 TaxID=3273376 RepID=UPI003617AD0A